MAVYLFERDCAVETIGRIQDGPNPLDRSMSRFDYPPKFGSTMNSHLGGSDETRNNHAALLRVDAHFDFCN
jgi:hypothetical protein